MALFGSHLFPSSLMNVPEVWHVQPFLADRNCIYYSCHPLIYPIKPMKQFMGKNLPKRYLMFPLQSCSRGSFGVLGTVFEDCTSWGLPQVWQLQLCNICCCCCFFTHHSSEQPNDTEEEKKQRRKLCLVNSHSVSLFQEKFDRGLQRHVKCIF